MNPLRLGTRGSALARWQAEWVAKRLGALGVDVELVLISTQGDQQQRGPIASLTGQGFFTKELQRALMAGEIDLAVHSLKDLPTETPDELHLAAVPPRGPCEDALVSREGKTLDQLPSAAVVGTGSARRRAQLLYAREDLIMKDVRGNVDTRLRKLQEGQFDALVLAVAGLVRLGLDERITQVLPHQTMLPAVGQGALGVESRTDDEKTNQAVIRLNDHDTHAAVTAERCLLAALRGGCLAPVGAWARVESGRLKIDAVVLRHDGKRRLTAAAAGSPSQAEQLGQETAASLLSQGAAELIAASRTTDERAQE